MREYLRAGLLDEMQIHLIPILLGGGVRLFDDLDPEGIELRRTSSIETPSATHFRFRNGEVTDMIPTFRCTPWKYCVPGGRRRRHAANHASILHAVDGLGGATWQFHEWLNGETGEPAAQRGRHGMPGHSFWHGMLSAIHAASTPLS
jgi:hypothetical protein